MSPGKGGLQSLDEVQDLLGPVAEMFVKDIERDDEIHIPTLPGKGLRIEEITFPNINTLTHACLRYAGSCAMYSGGIVIDS